MAKQIVDFMKVFLPRGFKLDPSSPSYCNDVFATGNAAKATMLEFLKARSIKKKHGSGLLKSLRDLRRSGALTDLIRAYRARVSVGQIVDPAPEYTKNASVTSN